MDLKPRVIPPNGDYSIADLTEWVSDAGTPAVNFIDAGLLGLANPESARLNAPNYVMFALCLAFEDLDCLHRFDLSQMPTQH